MIDYHERARRRIAAGLARAIRSRLALTEDDFGYVVIPGVWDRDGKPGFGWTVAVAYRDDATVPMRVPGLALSQDDADAMMAEAVDRLCPLKADSLT